MLEIVGHFVSDKRVYC